MEERSATDQPEHPSRGDRLRSAVARRLRKGIDSEGQNVFGEFLKGAAYKVGSAVVTLIIWWQARH